MPFSFWIQYVYYAEIQYLWDCWCTFIFDKGSVFIVSFGPAQSVLFLHKSHHKEPASSICQMWERGRCKGIGKHDMGTQMAIGFFFKKKDSQESESAVFFCIPRIVLFNGAYSVKKLLFIPCFCVKEMVLLKFSPAV